MGTVSFLNYDYCVKQDEDLSFADILKLQIQDTKLSLNLDTSE